MTEYLKPIGFWSHTSSDDMAARGRLSQLRLLLAHALQLRIGREPKVNIFQDVAAIPYGTYWLQQIRKALDESSFFIPIVTPAFLQSEMCCQEFTYFHAREIELGRDDLIFPLHYIDVDDVDANRAAECCDPAALRLLRSRQIVDFRPLWLRDAESEAIRVKLDEFATSIRRALRRQVATPTAAPVSPAAARLTGASDVLSPASQTRSKSASSVAAPTALPIGDATPSPRSPPRPQVPCPPAANRARLPAAVRTSPRWCLSPPAAS